MNVEAIYQNAQVISASVNGEINRVIIKTDEYSYLTGKGGVKNRYKGLSDDCIELDYVEFIQLINLVRKTNEFEEYLKNDINISDLTNEALNKILEDWYYTFKNLGGDWIVVMVTIGNHIREIEKSKDTEMKRFHRLISGGLSFLS